MIRLVALDVDGTLLGTGPDVSAAARSAVATAVQAGVRVSLATARSYHSALRLAGQLGLNAPLIVNAGAVVRDPATGQVLFERRLPREIAVAVAGFCDDNDLPVVVPYDDCTFLRALAPPIRTPAHVLMPDRIAPAMAGDPLSLIVQGGAAIALVLNRFGDTFAGFVNFSTAQNGDGTQMLNLTAIGADKGTALIALCDALQIHPAEAMAVGDADVDLPMFAVAGLSVAMGNAAPGVRAAARVVAPHVDDDGAAWAIHRFVLDGQTAP